MLDKRYLSPADARELLLSSLPKIFLQHEIVSIENAYGRILADDVIAPESLPSFPRSTVDGFAVFSSDTFGARENSPAYLRLSRDIEMGEPADFILARGEAARIPTGGMLPSEADSVVMLEHTQTVTGDMIEVMKAVAPGENVVAQGEDAKMGEKVLPSGRRLCPADIGALAGLGIVNVGVYHKPVVAIILTGDEIVPPGKAIRYGQVRDINSFTLSGLISNAGGAASKKGILRDQQEIILEAVKSSLLDSDIILITGGTSAGSRDYTASVINEVGQPGVLVHGVSLKPGKPLIIGLAGSKPIFGMPGHPAAVTVCFEHFVRPVIERIGGLSSSHTVVPFVSARLKKSVSSIAGREDHIRVSLKRENGFYHAVPVLGKSGLITTLTKADGIVVISSDALGIEAGDIVPVYLFRTEITQGGSPCSYQTG